MKINFGRWILLLVVGSLLSCGGDKKPAGILSQDDMVRTLMDLYITEEKVNRLALGRDSAAQVFGLMEQRIFLQRNLSDSVFKQSMSYYMDRPLELESIYTALVDSLQLREQRIAAHPNAP